MTRYTYLGVDSAVTLRDGICRRLVHGCEVELPEASAFTRALIAHGKLVPVLRGPGLRETRLPEPAAAAAEPPLERWVEHESVPEPLPEPEPRTLSGLAGGGPDEEDTSQPVSRGRRGKRS